MAERQFRAWNGEDLDPEYDFTEPTTNIHVVWEDIEVGGRAWKGEADVGTIVLRDERAETGRAVNLPAGLSQTLLSSHNLWQWTERHGSNTMARGRWGPKDYRRSRDGSLRADRHREVTISVPDGNWSLQGIIVDAIRPAETDTERATWLWDTYLRGSPRSTSDLSNTYLNTGSNTVALPAQHVTGNPRGVLEEIAALANKQFFVTVDDELFYDGNDSTAYVAGLAISDRIDEIDISGGTAALPVVHDVNIQDQSGAAGDEGTSADTFSLPITVGSGEDRALFLMVVSSNLPSEAAYFPGGFPGDNEALTRIQTLEVTREDGGNQRMTTWRLMNPTTETGSSVIRITQGSGSNASAIVWALTGANTADPNATPVSNTGTSQVTSLTVSATATQLPLNMAAWMNQNAPSLGNPVPGGSHTATEEGYFEATAGQADIEWGGGYGSTAPTWDFGDSHPWGAIGVAVNGGNVPTFPPIWDVGPAAIEDGQQLLSGLRLYYGQGSNTYVYVNSAFRANRYSHFEESLYAPENITTAAAATQLAQVILERRWEETGINCSIGPLTAAQAALVKYGQLISIKARAIPFADDEYFTGRIRQLRWTTPVPDMFFAHMQIGRPVKDLPYGIGNKAGSSAVTAHTEQGSNAHPEFVQRGILTTEGDIPYRGASDWTRLPIGSAGEVLRVTGGVPVWDVIDLEDLGDVDLTSPIPDDGDVLTFDDASGLWKPAAPTGGSGSVATDTIWDAAGDLAVGTGADTAARLAKGAALQHLRVNSGATALEWADPPSGGSGNAEHGLFTPSSTIDMSSPNTSLVTASDAGDYGTKLVTTGDGYWDKASAIGTGDFDVCMRVIYIATTNESSASGDNLIQFYVRDSSRTLSTQLAVLFRQSTESTTGNMQVQGFVGSSGTSHAQNGVTAPMLLRMKRVSTTVTYYWCPWQLEGIPIWHQIRGTTSSLDVGLIGARVLTNETEGTVVVDYVGNV